MKTQARHKPECILTGSHMTVLSLLSGGMNYRGSRERMVVLASYCKPGGFSEIGREGLRGR